MIKKNELILVFVLLICPTLSLHLESGREHQRHPPTIMVFLFTRHTMIPLTQAYSVFVSFLFLGSKGLI